MSRASPSRSSEDAFVVIANELFQKFHIAPVRNLSECEPSSFVTVYEGILGDRLKDVIRSPVTREDEINNVQCVVDSLSRDVLHCDLSHITGQAIVDHDIITTQYLLEILEGLVDYVMEQIGSETSSELDDFKPLQEVSLHSDAKGPSRRQKRNRSELSPAPFVRTRSMESISLPSSISPRPDMDELSEGSNSTAELIRLGEESASYRGRQAAQGKKNRDLNSTYEKAGLSKMFESYGISEGRLSQLTDTTLKDSNTTGPEPMSGSFSTITWPKAPSTLSSPSPVSKPTTSHSSSQPAHTKVFMAEKVPPYNRLLRSLTDDYSGLAGSSDYYRSIPATSAAVPTISSATKGYTTSVATDQPLRRSLRLTPQASATSDLPRGSGHGTPQDRSKLGAETGSSRMQPRSLQRTSPTLTPSARQGPQAPLMSTGQPLTPQGKDTKYPARLPYPYTERVQGRDLSPPVKGSPARSAGRTHPSELPHWYEAGRTEGQDSAPSEKLHDPAIAATYPARLPKPHVSPSRSKYRNSPSRQEVSFSPERDRYASRLPHHPVSSASRRTRGSPSHQEVERYPALLPSRTRTTSPSSTRGGSSISQSPGIASRLRKSARRSLERTAEQSVQDRRERSREDSSLGVEEEDTYDRSFMRRKVARRRRVAFEDEQSDRIHPECDSQEHPAQRFRYSQESDQEKDIIDIPYGHLAWDSIGQGRGDPSRTDSEEEERKESHSYHLRDRKMSETQKKTKAQTNKRSRQRSVLLERSIPQRQVPSKVQFEEAMERDAKGLLGKVRRQLAEEANQQAKMKGVLRHSYAGSLREVKRDVIRQVARRKRVNKQLDEDYKAMHGKPETTKYKPAKKYTVPLGGAEGSRRSTRSAKRSPPSKRKRAASASPTRSMLGGERPLRIGDDDLLPTLMYEFPFLHVSPHSAQRMWSQQMKHMEHLTKTAISQKYKKPRTQSKIEEAERKQEILVNIMKKELAHNQRLRDIKERRNQERALQAKAKEQRQVNARARRYYEEYRVRAKSRALKRRTKEEQIFKHLFEEGMAIQKARIRELRQYAKEKREDYTKQQQNEVESLENYYRDQFNLLAETIAKERHELNVSDRAQANAMKRIKSDMRRKMEKEIKEYQDQLYRDEDAEYFRQLEADRMKHELQMAKYKAQL